MEGSVMGISEEEYPPSDQWENAVGHSAKWVAIISAVYFIIMLFYKHELGVLTLAGGIFLVSFTTWMKNAKSKIV